MIQKVQVIDSHTAGEPTRMVVSEFPDLGTGPLLSRRDRFRDEFDHFRTGLILEPRGSDVIVGALLVEPHSPDCAAGVIFFNNGGFLGMCGHGLIGVVTSLASLGRISAGAHRIDTPVGVVTAVLDVDGSVAFENVPAYRFAQGVSVDVPGFGAVVGDIAYGGNWFFLVKQHPFELTPSNVDVLTGFTMRIKEALVASGIFGKDGAVIDHVELFSETPNAHSKNFVLCPGGEYDRSPCGTGTCAKLACLYEDGVLAEGDWWKQESILGGIFEGRVRVVDGVVYPTIRGRAFVTGESELVFGSSDPYCWGIRI